MHDKFIIASKVLTDLENLADAYDDIPSTLCVEHDICPICLSGTLFSKDFKLVCDICNEEYTTERNED